MECLLQKIFIYDFLRRHYPHQVWVSSKTNTQGSKFDYFLSACKHKLPCFYFVGIIHLFLQNAINNEKNAVSKRLPLLWQLTINAKCNFRNQKDTFSIIMIDTFIPRKPHKTMFWLFINKKSFFSWKHAIKKKKKTL